MVDTLETWWQKRFVRVLAYMGFAVLSFLVFLLWTFPDHRATQIAENQIEEALGHDYDVSVGDVAIWRLSGVQLDEVRLTEREVDDDEVDDDGNEGGGDEGGGEMRRSVLIDGISVRVSPLRSLTGGGLTTRYRIDVGEDDSIDGTVTADGDRVDVHANFDEVDLRQSTLLDSLLGVPIFGVIDGEIDVEIDAATEGLRRGEVDLEGQQLVLGATEVESDALPVTLNLPTTNFSDLKLELDIEPTDGGAHIDIVSFETGKDSTHPDIETETWGHIDIGQRRSQPRLQTRLRVDQAYVDDHNLGGMLDSLFREGQYQDWYGFVLSGTFDDINFEGSTTAAAQGPDGERRGEESGE